MDEDGPTEQVDVVETFGRYELRSLLGRGGMGEVWRAHDRRHERDVALKLMATEHAVDDGFRERFLREARLTARLTSQHVIPLHDFGEVEGRLYLDMRLVEGVDLAHVLADAPEGLPAPRAVAVVEQVAEALDSAHDAGLVHRDVKPSNILLARSRNRDFCYLVDFGIARSVDETGLTRTGTVLGTVAYMAPELFTGGEGTARSDVYALGCVLFEALTGRRAFGGRDTASVMHAQVYGDAPRTGRRDLGALDEVLVRALAKDPAERFARAGELAAAAAAALPDVGDRVPPPDEPDPASTPEPSPVPAAGPTDVLATPPPRRGGRRRRPLRVAGVLALLVALAAAGVVLALGARPGDGSDPPPPSAAPAAPRPAQLTVRPLPLTLDRPLRLVLTADGSRAYVAVGGTDGARAEEVAVVELPGGRVAATIPVPGRPSSVALSPDGATLYVGVRSADPVDPVAVVETATGRVSATVPVGQNPRGMVTSRDGRTLYVADAGYDDVPGGTVSVVDTVSRTVRRTITVGRAPLDVALSGDERFLYVPSYGDTTVAGSTVAVVDTVTGAIVASVPVAPAPAGVESSPDGRTVYVANEGDVGGTPGAVSVVDAATQAVRTTIGTGSADPFDVAVSPDGSRVVALAANGDAVGTPGSVSVVDTATARVIASAAVGADADAVRFSPDGRRAYVTTDTGLWVADIP